MGFHEMQKEAWAALEDFQTKIAQCPMNLHVRQLGENLAQAVAVYLAEEKKTKGAIDAENRDILLGLHKKIEEAWKAYARAAGDDDVVVFASAAKLVDITKKHCLILKRFLKNQGDTALPFDALIKRFEVWSSCALCSSAHSIKSAAQCGYHGGYLSNNKVPTFKSDSKVLAFREDLPHTYVLPLKTPPESAHVPNVAPNIAQPLLSREVKEVEDSRDWVELSKEICDYISDTASLKCGSNRFSDDASETGVDLDAINWKFQGSDIGGLLHIPKRKIEKIDGMRQFKSSHK